MSGPEGRAAGPWRGGAVGPGRTTDRATGDDKRPSAMSGACAGDGLVRTGLTEADEQRMAVG